VGRDRREYLRHSRGQERGRRPWGNP
jgi:hypothetical protein